MYRERIQKARERRNFRSRRKIFGMPDRPRLTVFRTGRHIYAQIVDDLAGVTLVSASTQMKSLRSNIKHGGNKEAAKVVGTTLAKRAQEVGIKVVCFDRNGYKYHGRIQSLADAAREAGLAF